MIKHLILNGLSPKPAGSGGTSIKTALYRFLSDAGITAKVYDMDLPQEPVYPVTVYDVEDENDIGRNHDGAAPFRDARIQIDVLAESGSQADALIEQWYTLLQSYDAVLSDGQSPETSYDVGIWYESTNPKQTFIGEPTIKTINVRSMNFKALYKQV